MAAGVLTHYYVALVPVALGEPIAIGIAAVATVPWLMSALPFQLGRTFFWEVPLFTVKSWSAIVASLVTGSDFAEGIVVASVVGLLLSAAVGIAWRRRAPTAAPGLLAVLMVPLIWGLAARSGYQVASRQAAILLLLLVYLLAGYGVAAIAAVGRRVRIRQRESPSRADVVVILAYAGGLDSPNLRSLGAMRAWFAEGGWTERSFRSQLLVYYRVTCALGGA